MQDLRVLYKNHLQGSEEFQTVFPMYNQDLSRDRVASRYQKLWKMVGQHIDQTIRTRNFKAQNERIETGVLVKGQKREKRQRGKKSGRVLSMESEWTVFTRRLIPVVLTTGLVLVKEYNSRLLLQERRHRLTEGSLAEKTVQEERVLQD